MVQFVQKVMMPLQSEYDSTTELSTSTPIITEEQQSSQDAIIAGETAIIAGRRETTIIAGRRDTSIIAG